MLGLILAVMFAGCGTDSEPTVGSDVGSDQGTNAGPREGRPVPGVAGNSQGAGVGLPVIAALGDSITAGSPLWDPDPAIRAQIGDRLNEGSQYEGWAAAKAERLGDKRSLNFRNCGVFGERTDEILNRLDDCAGDDTAALIVQGGINDIAQGHPIEEAAANLRAIVVEGKRRGYDVAITNVLPWNNGYPQAAPLIEDLNVLIAEIADDEEIPLLDFYATLEDPQSPGRMAPDLTDDGDHPSIKGYRKLGTKAFRLP